MLFGSGYLHPAPPLSGVFCQAVRGERLIQVGLRLPVSAGELHLHHLLSRKATTTDTVLFAQTICLVPPQLVPASCNSLNLQRKTFTERLTSPPSAAAQPPTSCSFFGIGTM